jgi:hypothetical protein
MRIYIEYKNGLEEDIQRVISIRKTSVIEIDYYNEEVHEQMNIVTTRKIKREDIHSVYLSV